MAQNVSSVRVQIIGDSRGLNAELLKASKAVSEFGNRTAKSSFNTLNSQLNRVQRSITEVAESYVTGGRVQRAEIEKLIELERRLQRQIDARDTAIAAARGDFTPLGTVIGPGGNAGQVRSLNNELASTSQRSGRASIAITQLGFAAEDAFVVMGNQGLSGALRAAGNNLSFVAAMFNPIAGIVVGVGLALSSLLIPALLKTEKRSKVLAETFRDLRKNIELTRIELRNTARTAAAEPLSVEGIFEGGGQGNRFATQRAEFKRSLGQATGDIELATRERQLALESVGSRTEGLLEGLPGLGGPLRTGELRIARSLQTATLEAIESGDTSKISKAFQTRLFQAQRLADVPGISISDTALDGLRSYVSELRELAQTEIDATNHAKELREALSTLTRNESIADTLRPVLQVGGRFEGLFNNLVSGFQADFGGAASNDRRNALAQADPLQAGFQFGSVEAISAINRATFSRPDPVEKDIEKNTSQTVDAVRDVINEVKNLGTAITTGIGNAITAGSPL